MYSCMAMTWFPLCCTAVLKWIKPLPPLSSNKCCCRSHLLVISHIYKFIYFYFVCMYVFICVCMPHSCSAHGSQKKAMNFVELEYGQFWIAMWVLGTKLSLNINWACNPSNFQDWRRRSKIQGLPKLQSSGSSWTERVQGNPVSK